MKKRRRKVHTGRKARQNKRIVILTGIVAAIASLFVVAMIIWLFIGSNTGEAELAEESVDEASVESENISEVVYVDESIIQKITSDGQRVSKALSDRPATVEIAVRKKDEPIYEELFRNIDNN